MMQRVRALAARAALCAAVIASGCDGGDGSEVAIEAGTSDPDGNGYQVVEDGTDVSLVAGAQSGFHVWLNVRVRGIAGDLYLAYTARRQRDGVLVLRGLPVLLRVPDAALGDWWARPMALPAFMCPSPVGIQIFDEPLVFEVRLLLEPEEEADAVAEDRLILIPHCPEGTQAEFCASICSG